MTEVMRMIHTYRPMRTRSRRTRRVSVFSNVYRLPDGRIMYIWYNKNPITGTARPYIAADDGTTHQAYIPPLPDQIQQKYPALNPSDTRMAAAMQIKLAKLLRLPKMDPEPTAEERLSQLADWLAVMYRLTDTVPTAAEQQPVSYPN
ncbi:MAG TPA: hypothetical protein O0X51_05340 [Methanocorpusculum sp.]|nr:hypothetical protein [Methanocorpusculum sp.]